MFGRQVTQSHRQGMARTMPRRGKGHYRDEAPVQGWEALRGHQAPPVAAPARLSVHQGGFDSLQWKLLLLASSGCRSLSSCRANASSSANNNCKPVGLLDKRAAATPGPFSSTTNRQPLSSQPSTALQATSILDKLQSHHPTRPTPCPRLGPFVTADRSPTAPIRPSGHPGQAPAASPPDPAHLWCHHEPPTLSNPNSQPPQPSPRPSWTSVSPTAPAPAATPTAAAASSQAPPAAAGATAHTASRSCTPSCRRYGGKMREAARSW